MTNANKKQFPYTPSSRRVIDGVLYVRFATFNTKVLALDAISKVSESAKSQLKIRKLNKTTYAVYRTASSFK